MGQDDCRHARRRTHGHYQTKKCQSVGAPPTSAPNEALAKFWHYRNDVEELSYTTIAEAVEAWVDNHFPAALPETITVYGYWPMPLPSVADIAQSALDEALYRLDEDHGDPSGNDDGPTDAMKAAALVFAGVIRAEYTSWMCEQFTSPTVRLADYIDVAEYAEKAEANRAPENSNV